MVRKPNETVALSQTLDRGLACLDFVAASDRAVTVDEAAAALGLHRSIVYRLMRTL
ncbi:MAG: helix-turn-helix domain-containing protein, partial [Ilumatobacteraceae bacterium]